MATTIYQGAGKYEIHIGSQVLYLDEEELTDILGEFYDDNNRFEIPYVQKQKQDNEILKDKLLLAESKLTDILEICNEA